MQFTFSIKTFFLVDLSRWKRNKFKISIKLHLKNGKIFVSSLISSSFYELHRSTIDHMNHLEPMFQDLPFYCTKKVPKTTFNFVTFVTGVDSLPGACSDLDLGKINFIFSAWLIWGRAQSSMTNKEGTHKLSLQLIIFIAAFSLTWPSEPGQS